MNAVLNAWFSIAEEFGIKITPETREKIMEENSKIK